MDKSTHAQKRISSLSAVFPAYNDAGTIPSMILTALLAACQGKRASKIFDKIIEENGASPPSFRCFDVSVNILHGPINIL